jgi:LysR family transcriptional regulator, chromosome initiation inhibitor
MRSLEPLALECLVALVEEGGFQRAARRLSVTQSAVSQRLWALEANVGSILIVRSRPLRPTPAGQVLLRHAKLLNIKQAELVQELQDLAPAFDRSPRVDQQMSIALDPDSMATWALSALGEFSRAGQPTEIILDYAHLTHERLRDGQALGCVTTVDQALHGCKAVALGSMNYVAVADRNFAEQHCPQGLTPQNFRGLKFIAHSRSSDLQAKFVSKTLGLRDISLSQHFVPSPEGQLHAVRAGWGVSVLPELLVAHLLREEVLVDLAPHVKFAIDLHWHSCSFESDLIDRLDRAISAGARRLAPNEQAVPELEAEYGT